MVDRHLADRYRMNDKKAFRAHGTGVISYQINSKTVT
jgi:hypothetical protein